MILTIIDSHLVNGWFLNLLSHLPYSHASPYSLPVPLLCCMLPSPQACVARPSSFPMVLPALIPNCPTATCAYPGLIVVLPGLQFTTPAFPVSLLGGEEPFSCPSVTYPVPRLLVLPLPPVWVVNWHFFVLYVITHPVHLVLTLPLEGQDRTLFKHFVFIVPQTYWCMYLLVWTCGTLFLLVLTPCHLPLGQDLPGQLLPQPFVCNTRADTQGGSSPFHLFITLCLPGPSNLCLPQPNWM